MIEVNRCEACGSHNVKNKRISFDYMNTTVKEVPVIICEDCGEEMIMSDVLEHVETLITKGIRVYKD